MMEAGKIVKVSGPLVVAENIPGAKMYDTVKVGEKGLIGEIISLERNLASIQVYEETAGLGPGEPVISSLDPLSVELGPGLIGSIYDGVQRPLTLLREKVGTYIVRGIDVPALDKQKEWEFKPILPKGEKVSEGDVLGIVKETPLIDHKLMVPHGISGTVQEIKEGKFTVIDTIATVVDEAGKSHSIQMLQRWPVRKFRPYQQKLPPRQPLISGQRIIDTFFPIAKGGTACVPGPFGSGKTVLQHAFSKWVDAEIIIFIGCGERGNEMTDVLIEFPRLKDPKTGQPLMKKTILIANTSNMPIAAREASVYTGITIAEYFRDMGYNVALMADSTSRCAEAFREMSGRLEEMPGEEGYPAYLGARIASFYERAGKVKCLGSPAREGSVTIIGAVSPPGGDLSEPVVQNTLIVVKIFWGLDDRLAYKRHFPAINWLQSYSLYLEDLEESFGKDWARQRMEAMKLLSLEAELEEIVRLVGLEALAPKDQLILQVAKLIREDFLHQNAFDEIDTYTPPSKQFKILKLIMTFYKESLAALEKEIELKDLFRIEALSKIAKAKFMKEEEINLIESEVVSQLKSLYA